MDNNQKQTTIPWYPPVQSEPMVNPLVQNNITVAEPEPLTTPDNDYQMEPMVNHEAIPSNVEPVTVPQEPSLPEPMLQEPVLQQSTVQEPVGGMDLPPVPNTSSEPLKEVPMTPVAESSADGEDNPPMPWQLGPTGNIQNWW